MIIQDSERRYPDIGDLNRLYDEAEEENREAFAEFRSNILMMAGEHYSRRSSEGYRSLRDRRDWEAIRRLRIVKNFCHKVVRYYVNHFLDYAPKATVDPQNELEMQDCKDAELNNAVWDWAWIKERIKEKLRKWGKDFAGVGEVAVKVFFDPFQGELKNYEPLVDEFGQPFIDSSGQPVPDREKPVFSGRFVFERIPAYNIMPLPRTREMEETEGHIIRKMMPVRKLLEIYGDDNEKRHFITKAAEEEFIVFDGQHQGYTAAKGEVLVREFYFKPCYSYPEGWYVFSTKAGILEEGPLPVGVYPICWAGFDEAMSKARCSSIVRVIRPSQIELNRASSSAAQHQITVGDDKVLYQAGTKLQQGGLLPGVRGITYQGVPPTILPGRDGSQYFPYMDGTKNEIYELAMLSEMAQRKMQNFDPVAFLFSAAVERKDFSTYTEKFEQFQQDVLFTFLQLAKHYLPEDELIYAAGRREMVNIEEFRKTQPLRSQIKTDITSETLERKLGKQLTGMQIMQYFGKQLGKEDMARLVREMPYGNFGKVFDDFTIDQTNAENDMLAIERGQAPAITEYENNEYTSMRIAKRMKEPDFETLDPQIQQAYQLLMAIHNQQIAMKEQKIIEAKNEYIPIDGGLVKLDMYVPKPDDPTKQERATLPQRAIEWLIAKLAQQGQSLDKFQDMSTGQQAQIAEMITQPGGGQPPVPGQGAALPPSVGVM